MHLPQVLATLDIGYVLFGDDYKRGELLANLNQEHRKANNDCGTELADHLGICVETLRERSLINDRARAAYGDPLFSTKIRSHFVGAQ